MYMFLDTYALVCYLFCQCLFLCIILRLFLSVASCSLLVSWKAIFLVLRLCIGVVEFHLTCLKE